MIKNQQNGFLSLILVLGLLLTFISGVSLGLEYVDGTGALIV